VNRKRSATRFERTKQCKKQLRCTGFFEKAVAGTGGTYLCAGAKIRGEIERRVSRRLMQMPKAKLVIERLRSKKGG
jgi:hypothetical protein